MGTSDEPSACYHAVAVGTIANLFPFPKFSQFNILLQRGMDIEPFPAARTSDVRWLKIIPHYLLSA